MNKRIKRENFVSASTSLLDASEILARLAVRMDATEPGYERVVKCKQYAYLLYKEVRQLYEESFTK